MRVFGRQDLFEDFNREINPRFTAQTYDLMKHNCNNYTDESAKFLLGKGIPSCKLQISLLPVYTPQMLLLLLLLWLLLLLLWLVVVVELLRCCCCCCWSWGWCWFCCRWC